MKSNGAIAFSCALSSVLLLATQPWAVAQSQSDAPPPPVQFEQTPGVPWAYESGAENVAQAAAPEDPKLDEVNAELDRLNRNAANPAPSSQAAGPYPSALSVLKVLLGLCVVIATILLLTQALKKWGKRSPLFAVSDLVNVLGKYHLTPRVSLHFVRTGGRVLVIGVTPNSVSLVAEFDEAAFDTRHATETASEQADLAASRSSGRKALKTANRFLDELNASTRKTAAAREEPAEIPETGDPDIDALRQDIVRLQKFLKEDLREEQ